MQMRKYISIAFPPLRLSMTFLDKTSLVLQSLHVWDGEIAPEVWRIERERIVERERETALQKILPFGGRYHFSGHTTS